MNSAVAAAEWEEHLADIEAQRSIGDKLLAAPENRFLAPLVVPGQVILDAGCGNGRHLFAYAGAGARAVGVDFSSRITRKVQGAVERNNISNVRAVTGDILALPFEDGQFDLYTSFGVYEHFNREQHKALFSEAYRVLKPGGHIYLEVPQCWSAWTARRQLRYWFRKLRPPGIVWQRNLRRAYLCRCGQTAGFRTVASHVFDAWLAMEKGFSLGRPSLKGIPNPLCLGRPLFKAVACWCEKREWLGHTLVYVGRKPSLNSASPTRMPAIPEDKGA